MFIFQSSVQLVQQPVAESKSCYWTPIEYPIQSASTQESVGISLKAANSDFAFQ